MEFLEFLKVFLGIVIGAASAGIPLWIKIKRVQQQLQGGDIKLHEQAAKAANKDKINTEAEWKRIIEFRDAELVRLRERDDQQERQITELWNKNIECQRSEAAQGAKIEAQNDKIRSNEERIRHLETRMDELLKVLIVKAKENDNAAHERRDGS